MSRVFPRAALLLALIAAGTLLVTGTASAGTTTTTLVSGNGTIGGADASVEYWNGTAWVPAQIITPHPFYSTIAGTKWIGLMQGGGGPVFVATPFRIAFTLPAGYAAPSLDVSYYADNYADVYLNGTWIGGQPHVPSMTHFGFGGAPPSVAATADPSLFHEGVNYLTFGLIDEGNPQGLDFKATVTFTELPTTTLQCKKGGWEAYGVFKNQGDCVSFVATGGSNPPANG